MDLDKLQVPGSHWLGVRDSRIRSAPDVKLGDRKTDFLTPVLIYLIGDARAVLEHSRFSGVTKLY